MRYAVRAKCLGENTEVTVSTRTEHVREFELSRSAIRRASETGKCMARYPLFGCLQCETVVP